MKPLTSAEIHGNWATLLLATRLDGSLDPVKLSDEIDTLIAARPNGIYSNGTAGEFYSQSIDEFIAINSLLSEKCHAANIPFQIGVSHPCADASLERLQAIRHLTPSAVQLILPDWFPVTNAEATIFLERMVAHANGLPIVLYNPPHAKRRLTPAEFATLHHHIPSLVGVKVFDQNRSAEWYAQVREHIPHLSVFVPGHHLASGVASGAAQGAYSNVACLNPHAAQRWYEQMHTDIEGALELEVRIRDFMDHCIAPFITRDGYPNHACDRFMALVGGWADVGDRLRWPYASIPADLAPTVRQKGRDLIPEFFE